MTNSTIQMYLNLNDLEKVEVNEKIDIYQPYEAEQILLAENASVLAVKTYLKMLGRQYEVKSCRNAEFISAQSGRKTKVPVCRFGHFVVSEFEPIINLFEQKKLSLTENFTMHEKDDLITLMSLAEQIFTNAELYITWIDETVYNQITKLRYGSVYSFPLNHIQTWRKLYSVKKQLNFYDWEKLTFEEVVEKVDKLCESLVLKLGDKDYFFGSSPCELDALVFGHLFCIFTMELPGSVSSLKETINKYNPLTSFVFRIEQKFFGKIKNN